MILDKHSVAWAAGLFEGEGHVRCQVMESKYVRTNGEERTYRTPCLKLAIEMTDRDVLSKFSDVFDLGVPRKRRVAKENPRWKDRYVIDVGSRYKVMTMMTAMWPYLGTRRRDQFREAMVKFKS